MTTMPRRRRNRILIRIIGLGLLNFVCFTIIYAYIGGDAPNGKVQNGTYFVKGHFLRHGLSGQATEVSEAVWIYSYVHSISIWPTIGAVLCSMLVLARPHIIATMQEDNLIRGQSFVTASITTIVIISAASTIYFCIDFVRAMQTILGGGDYGT